MKLEEEARQFKKTKNPKATDKIALRFYMGQALCGFIASGRSTGRAMDPEELMREALQYARLACEYEDNF